MDGSIEQFNAFLLNNFFDQSSEGSIPSLDYFVEKFRDDPLWLARVLVVQCMLDPSKLSAEHKEETLNFYSNYATDALSCIEAARAAAVFEEPEVLKDLLERAQRLLDFTPKVVGVPVKYTADQASPRTRVGCLAKSLTVGEDQEPGRTIDNVRLNEFEKRLEPPQFMNSEEEQLSTSLLSNMEYLVLLLHTSYTNLSNPASTTTIVNEQALPFIRRITETFSFERVDFAIQERALFDRSVLEMKDINELERGTVQLMKISEAIHSPHKSGVDLLKYFHQIVPLPWREVDELTARRLVAISDFKNAIPFFRNLNRPLDIAICLTGIGATDEALKVLESKDCENDPKALLLRGDISSNAELWQQAWDTHKEPRAKFRLAQKSVADASLEEALKHLDDLLACQPTHYEALQLAANTAMALQKWSAAATYLRRSLAINDDDTRGWSNLATALLQSDQPQAAHHAVKQAIRVNQNVEPDQATYSNYIALSAQLGLYDDVLVGLDRLADGAARATTNNYIAKVSGVLPRLVAHFTKTDYTGSTPQLQLIKLFSEKLPKVISPDDPMLCRMTGLVEIWAQHYQKGLNALNKAVEVLFRDINAAGTETDPRLKARAQLYSQDLISNLEKFGDKPGRVEGSTAFPGWKARIIEVERGVEKLS